MNQREIKFRAYHKEEGCMYYTQSSLGMEGDGWIDNIDFNGRYADLGCQADGSDYYQRKSFDEVELMQFTGLKDKNGKEIYEGDVVKWERKTVAEKHRLGVVRWNDDVLKYELVRKGGNGSDVARNLRVQDPEVIGNVYENPELLQDAA